jgi:signal transduction histidine kinase
MPGGHGHRWLFVRIAVALAPLALATATLLDMTAAGGAGRIVDVAPVGIAYWTGVGGGAIGLAFALWIHAAAPRQWGTRCYLITAIGFAISAWTAATLALGPALPAGVRAGVSAVGWPALALFMGAFAAMFLRFPQPLVSLRASWAILAAGAVFAIVAAVPRGGHYPFFTTFLCSAIVALVALVLVQAWQGRHDARIRLRLGVVAATVVLGAALYLLVDMFWPHADDARERVDVLFPLNTMIFMGIGLTTGPATIFAKGGWGRSVMIPVTLATAALLLDALLLAFATRQQGAALGLAVAAVAGIYIPLRTLSGRRAEQRRDARARATLDLAAAVAFATSPPEVEAQWHAALRTLFDPQSIEPVAGGAAAPHCLDGGAALYLPAFQSLPPLVCRQADRGRRLFAEEDVVTVKSLIRILDQLITGRDAYLRGVEVERDRIARDLHDDVNGRLVTSLLRDDPAAMRDDVRGAISEIRTIVRAADGNNRSLANLLADLRHETMGRLEAVGVELDWPVRPCPSDPVIDYLTYRHVASILRECVTNIIRHAEATRVRIDAEVGADAFEIDIADNGRGAGPVPNPGNGLVNCRRRAALIGGTFHVEPRAHGFAQRLAAPITAAPA